MKTLRTPITETASYSSGETSSIDVRLKGYVTQIDVLITLNITADSSAAPESDDTLLRAVKSMKFTSSGSPDFYSIRDLREGWWLSYIKSQGQAYADTLDAGTMSATDKYIQFSIHPGSNFGNPYDMSRCIPLRDLSNVQFQVTWGSDSDLGTGYTINSGNLAIVVYTNYLEKGESEADAFKPLNYLMRPRYVPVLYEPGSATYDSYGFSQNILTGAYVRDVALMVLSSGDVRSNTDVTAFQVADNLGHTPLKVTNFTQYVRETQQRYYLPATNAGIVMVPFKSISGKDYGLNMVGASLGDWKIEFTTGAASGHIHALYEMADLINIDPTVVG